MFFSDSGSSHVLISPHPFYRVGKVPPPIPVGHEISAAITERNEPGLLDWPKTFCCRSVGQHERLGMANSASRNGSVSVAQARKHARLLAPGD